MTRTDERRKKDLLDCLVHCMDDHCGECRMRAKGSNLTCMEYAEDNVTVPARMIRAIRDMLEAETAEGLWIYCPDDEGRPRWKCSRCGKYVHKDPAEKLYCSLCGQRNRKEA